MTINVDRARELATRVQLPDQYGSRDEEAAELGRIVVELLSQRDDVTRFAQTMNVKMQAKEPERGNSWRHMSPQWLIARLREHVDKLDGRLQLVPVSHEQTRRDAADVANYAMMVAEIVEQVP